MQEELERKSISVTVQATKLTGRVMRAAIAAALRKIEKERNTPKVGRNSMRRLTAQTPDAHKIEVEERIRSFERYAGLSEYVTPAETDGEKENAEAPEETGASSVSLPTVDFESLLAQGPDVKAWLELPGTVIQYPVAQGEDNSYYLKHLYDGTANKVGCLFIDYENAEDFSDNNTIIYGHNMRDGSMFSTLVEYKAQAYYDEHPEMYLVTPDGGYVAEVFSAFVASPEESGSETSPWALEWKDSGAYTTWLSAMQERSVIETGVSVTSSDKVLTLSTCTNGGADRFIVMGRLVAVTE